MNKFDYTFSLAIEFDNLVHISCVSTFLRKKSKFNF